MTTFSQMSADTKTGESKDMDVIATELHQISISTRSKKRSLTFKIKRRSKLRSKTQPIRKLSRVLGASKNILLVGRGGPEQSPIHKRIWTMRVAKKHKDDDTMRELISKCNHLCL